jgi:hypothetical protein
MAYHHILQQEHTRQTKLQADLEARKEHADASSQRRAQLSSLHSSSARTPKQRSRLQNMHENERRELSTSLDSSFMMVDTAGNLMAKMVEGAVIAATTYLLANQPQQNDPRAAIHRSTIAGLGLISAAERAYSKSLRFCMFDNNT